MRGINLIVIHCSATRETTDYPPEQLERDHLKRKINAPMGYHYYIRKDGTIVVGRKISQMGAHVYGHNTTSVGICYEGGLDADGNAKDTRTLQQKAAIVAVIQGVLIQLLRDGQGTTPRICGHRDLSPDVDGDGVIEQWEWLKQCPCFDAREEYAWLNP